MSVITVVKIYLALNLLFALVSLLLVALTYFGRVFSYKLSYGHLLKLSYALVLVSLIAPLALLQYPGSKIWAPKAQIWSSINAKSLGVSVATAAGPRAAISVGSAVTSVQLEFLTIGFLVLLGIGILCVGWRLVLDAKSLSKILEQGFVLKRVGRVSLLASGEPIVPFSAWLPFRSYVVVPQTLLSNFEHFKLVVKHELQHHRQNDTRWIYVLQLVKALCFWNPFVLLLQKQVGDLQEVACDEALTGHQGVSSRAYCDCLLWVAQNTLLSRTQLVGTAGFARGSAAKLLRWRVEEMLKIRTKYVSGAAAVGVGLIMSGFLAVATAATHSSIQDRRISSDDAQKMVENAADDDFPIVVNDLVLEQLNRFLGTPDGRAFMSRSIALMHNYEDSITQYLDRYKLPHELLAVPLIESGYQNLSHDGNPAHGAGLWMFIASTARNFGLRVDDAVDDRLDVALETDAAMRLLGGLNLQFKDWGLALLGYNAGDGFVNRAVSATGSRDVWELIRKGYENDPHYVASVMAAVLIMKNPSSLAD